MCALPLAAAPRRPNDPATPTLPAVPSDSDANWSNCSASFVWWLVGDDDSAASLMRLPRLRIGNAAGRCHALDGGDDSGDPVVAKNGTTDTLLTNARTACHQHTQRHTHRHTL